MKLYGKYHIKTLLLFLMCALFVSAFYPVWTSLISKWSTSDEYSHGFLILPICLFIIYRKRDKLSSVPIAPSRLGLILILFSFFIYLFSFISEIVTLASISMIFTIIGIILYLFGTTFFKNLLFPIFLLFLMIPLPSQLYATLTIPLQLFVSKMSHSIIFLFGLPIYREGNVIFTQQGALEVVQACSGLRSIISLFTLFLVFGYFTLHLRYLILFLSIFSIPVAIFINILRVVVTVLSRHFFNYDLTTGSAHTFYGMVIFFIAIVIMLFISKALLLWEKFTQEKSSY